jgi:uroporphyrin-3 C-methyltransferase
MGGLPLLESGGKTLLRLIMSDPLDRPVPQSSEAAAAPAADAADAADVAVREMPAADRAADVKPGAKTLGASRTLIAGVAVLVIAASVAVWLDGRRTQQALRAQVAQRLSELEAASQATGKAQTLMATELRDTQAKIALLEARIAESQAQQAALEALYRDLAPSRDEIALTEIEQVLLVASQQLQLAGNVQSALAALQLADARLQRLERPQFLPLRRALTRDMDRLKAMPFVDVAGMSLKLDQALVAVNSLPLAMDERLPPPVPATSPPVVDEPSWQRLLREAWAEIRQLVRVEVADRPAAPLLIPSQQYFLRENLKLRFLSARIGLLNRDDASFKDDVVAAEGWLRLYFDTRSKSVQTLQATLKQLAATPMAGEMPDLAGSLEAVRVLRLAQERSPGRPGDRADRAPPRPAR